MAQIQEIIYVDESGILGLSQSAISNHPIFSYGFVYCRDPNTLRKRLRRLLRRLHLRNRYPPRLRELKFYIPYHKMLDLGYTRQQIQYYVNHLPYVRNRALNIILNSVCLIFSAILDKRTIQRTSWTSETLGNFIFAQTLFVNILNNIQPQFPPNIIFDDGRLSAARTPRFQGYVLQKQSYFGFKGFKQYAGLLGAPLPASSLLEPGLWAADIVAGAFYHKYRHHDPSYANMLSPIYIGAGERRYWF